MREVEDKNGGRDSVVVQIQWVALSSSVAFWKIKCPPKRPDLDSCMESLHDVGMSLQVDEVFGVWLQSSYRQSHASTAFRTFSTLRQSQSSVFNNM